MRRNYIIIVLMLVIMSCTKDNFIDTGISKGRFNGNVLEYMEAHPYDWDSTRLLIKHAGEDMVRLFEGNDPQHKEIPFFGLTNHSIRRYLLHNGLSRVTDLDPEWCHSVLMQHVVDGKLYRKDIPTGEEGDFGTLGSGGMMVKSLAGKECWVYVKIEPVDGRYVEFAPRHIFINFMSTENIAIMSGDIEPNNALIHALDYNFTIGDSMIGGSSDDENEDWW